MKHLKVPAIIFCSILFVISGFVILVESSGPDDEIPAEIPTEDTQEPQEIPNFISADEVKDWTYMKIEHDRDLLTPKRFFALMDSTDNQVPLITGGYAGTDVYLIVELRGVEVARSLQNREDRQRPHDFILRERQRWSGSLKYLWNLIEPTKTLRAYNIEVVAYDENERATAVRADLEVLLGGNWMNLAMLMLGDEHARPTQADGSDWDFGSLSIGLTNPAIPK